MDHHSPSANVRLPKMTSYSSWTTLMIPYTLHARAVTDKELFTGGPDNFLDLKCIMNSFAFGDRMMKSASKRQAIAKNISSVLGFEMEAAGITTESSCFVIRVISNYADSHKNDRLAALRSRRRGRDCKRASLMYAARHPWSDMLEWLQSWPVGCSRRLKYR